VLFLFEVSLSTSSIREGIDSMIKEEAEHSLESADD
jgi:hypothetical protein